MEIDEQEVEIELREEDNDVISSRNWPQVALEQRNRLNDGQRSVYDEILAAARLGSNAPNRLFFVTGEGGTAEQEICVATATTGIASLLLVGGLTAHRAFRIRNDIDEESAPTIAYESPFAERLRSAAFILIDEVSMLHTKVFNYINRVILSVVPPEHRHLPFGGKMIILSGDFKQLAPVAPGEGRDGQIGASIRHSDLFSHFRHLQLTTNMRVNPGEAEFTKWLSDVGNGKNMIDESSSHIAIPTGCGVSNLNELVDFVFPNRALEDPLNRVEDLRGAGILCTRNETVAEVNEMLLARIPTQERTYDSVDDIIMDRQEQAAAQLLDVYADDLNLESIHKMTPTGLPPHKLHLKEGAIIMIIRNMSVSNGLCNGTMLQVLEMGDTLLKCRRLEADPRFDEIVLLPRVKFEFGTGLHDRTVQFKRVQFPVRLAFANTINKAQGQTLRRVGLYFQGQQAFGHGQLYTAFSRVRNVQSIRVLCIGLKRKGQLRNVVFDELLL